jgi:hypothetical protein
MQELILLTVNASLYGIQASQVMKIDLPTVPISSIDLKATVSFRATGSRISIQSSRSSTL